MKKLPHDSGAAQGDGFASRDGLVEAIDAVQVRIDGDHLVEQIGKEVADDALANGFSRVKGDVLAHIAKIGGNQGQM